MDIRVAADYGAASRMAADMIISLVREEQEALLILPSGETPRGTYRLLVGAHERREADFSRLTVVALDEWGGRSGSHPLSCHRMIASAFVEPVGIPPERFHSLDGTAVDPEAECAWYDRLLQRLPRPALSFLGLGTNGHIALNEPAASLPAASHVALLADSTLKRAAKELGGGQVVPYGLTLGMAQILSAETVLLMATGHHKKTAVQSMLGGSITTECPASLLQLHPTLVVVLDQAAAPEGRM